MRSPQNAKSHNRISPTLICALCICVLSQSHAAAQDYETNPNLKGVTVYDHDPATHLGDDVFGTVVADFRESVDGEYRCSHGGPVCMEYADGTLVAFYANTSSHNIDGWSEFALSNDGGKTWDKYHPFPFSRDAYRKNPKQPVWIEEGLVTERGTAVLILTQFDTDKGSARTMNYIARSRDHGKTWSDPEPFAAQVVGYPAAVAKAGSTSYVLFDTSDGPHELYASTDDGQTWNKQSTLALQDDAWYGALCVMENGDLLAGAYVTNDENHLYYCISQDGGRTWSEQQKAHVDKKIRDPELAYLAGKYYLHGRSGSSGEFGRQFVLYQSDDGIHWNEGVIVSGNKAHPDGYSHNCIVNKHDANTPQELMILYSIVYQAPRTSEYVFFVKPESR